MPRQKHPPVQLQEEIVPSISGYALLRPDDWQAFERSMLVLTRCVLDDPNAQLHGLPPDKQHGVDIFGRRKSTGEWVGVQCKNYSKSPSRAELRRELDEAKKFEPVIGEFILATTAPRDDDLQSEARRLTDELSATERPITVVVWSWQEIKDLSSSYVEASRAFDPTSNAFAEEANRNVLALRDEMHARFDGIENNWRSRPRLSLCLIADGATSDGQALVLRRTRYGDMVPDEVADGLRRAYPRGVEPKYSRPPGLPGVLVTRLSKSIEEYDAQYDAWISKMLSVAPFFAEESRLQGRVGSLTVQVENVGSTSANNCNAILEIQGGAQFLGPRRKAHMLLDAPPRPPEWEFDTQRLLGVDLFREWPGRHTFTPPPIGKASVERPDTEFYEERPQYETRCSSTFLCKRLRHGLGPVVFSLPLMVQDNTDRVRLDVTLAADNLDSPVKISVDIRVEWAITDIGEAVVESLKEELAKAS